MDPPGAARARAFHDALLAAARARNGARGVSDASSTGWVGAKFAAPLLAATTAASSSFDRAHATLIASFVEAHGAACLPGGDARALAARCLETSRSSKTTDAGFEPATDAAATVLAALSRAAPETWDETLDALAAPGEDAAERRRALAAILEKLEDTFDERGVDERSADRVVASRWRRPALDAALVDAVSASAADPTNDDANDATATLVIAASRASSSGGGALLSPDAAAIVTRKLAAAAAAAMTATDVRARVSPGWALRASESLAWPPPSDPAARDPWLELVVAAFGAHLSALAVREVTPTARDEGAASDSDISDSDISDSDSNSASASDISDSDISDSESFVEDAPSSSRPGRDSVAGDASWVRIERAMAASPAPASASALEGHLRDALARETARRLEPSANGSFASASASIRIADAWAGATVAALVASGAAVDAAARMACRAALETAPKSPKSSTSRLPSVSVSFVSSAAACAGSWTPALAASEDAGAVAAAVLASDVTSAAASLEAHLARGSTAASAVTLRANFCGGDDARGDRARS